MGHPCRCCRTMAKNVLFYSDQNWWKHFWMMMKIIHHDVDLIYVFSGNLFRNESNHLLTFETSNICKSYVGVWLFMFENKVVPWLNNLGILSSGKHIFIWICQKNIICLGHPCRCCRTLAKNCPPYSDFFLLPIFEGWFISD